MRAMQNGKHNDLSLVHF